MHAKPTRYQNQRCLHFITFSCYRRMQLLATPAARAAFEYELERVRRWYGCGVAGYVVTPEHIHLLLGEPERGKLSLVVQMVKQLSSRKLKPPDQPHFWQVRYYDFPVWSENKRIEKLRYMHRNPVKRGLVARPEDWSWSSFRTLRDRSRWRGGDRVGVDGAQAREARNRNHCPPSRKKRGKGGATV